MLALVLMAALNNDLADKVIAAYGGAEAWKKVESFKQAGRVVSQMRSGEGKLSREWQRPDKLRVEIVYPSHTELRIVDGDHGTQNGKEANGMGLDAMRLQAARLALPLLLAEKRAELTSPAKNTIEIPLPSSMTLTIEVDPATGRVLKSTGRAEGIEFTTSYSDFRKVDGLLFAFREANTAQGMPTGNNEISSVEVHLRK